MLIGDNRESSVHGRLLLLLPLSRRLKRRAPARIRLGIRLRPGPRPGRNRRAADGRWTPIRRSMLLGTSDCGAAVVENALIVDAFVEAGESGWEALAERVAVLVGFGPSGGHAREWRPVGPAVLPVPPPRRKHSEQRNYDREEKNAGRLADHRHLLHVDLMGDRGSVEIPSSLPRAATQRGRF